MADCHSNLVLKSSLLITAALILLPSTSASSGGDHRQLGWPTTIGGCQGSLAECLTEDEFSMDSEINRRILATTQYISYGALQRNSVPCSRRGASYYNCKPGGEANPYTRGCSAITRCRS